MLDISKIEALSAEEIIVVNGLLEVAKKAAEDAKLIADSFHSFGINEDRIEVWNDGNNAEYITHDGFWQARYLHQTYDVKVDVNTIYEYYRAEWLVDHGYVKSYEGNIYTQYGEMKLITGYFKSFVNRIKLS